MGQIDGVPGTVVEIGFGRRRDVAAGLGIGLQRAAEAEILIRIVGMAEMEAPAEIE